ncbi:hypothetical protein PTNB85_09125 [Pyrenophora teres f. teres]|uniref:Uncharacterized protein n=1 Tax=Pyrenophora teres f. teres TaxID=97479 RepID=A0A6S6VEC9_9PLEO|nr:hypothetical protein HRS9139_10030 [Pyrenophora teres f. teres]KAE8826180.1 hypothetical protein PTNB85_09125 [Pyrenophora teres f. teres]KAE8852760.1 hypothetical protein PTNB29_10150 [Pyrenophora teres f. teres]CAE7001677.1 hypothetical protein PTTW11_01277 [Pyrenophora teres f. teres]
MGTTKSTQPTNTLAPVQLDGGADYHPRARPSVITSSHARPAIPFYSQQQYHGQMSHQSRHGPSVPPPPRQQTHTTTTSTVRDLLPYCTTEPPLDEAQVIALSDVVGSLKELVLLSLCATSGDVSSMEKLEGAVGQQTAANITDFFADEWEIDG